MNADFLDYAELYMKSGNGGNGSVAFMRFNINSKPEPTGGDGGDGGNIILRSDKNIRSLHKFRFLHHIKAGPGEHGQNNNKKGASGKDALVEVPVGTVVYDEKRNIVYDFRHDREEVLLLKGGRGGLGNARFRNSKMNRPRFALKGEITDKSRFILELKILADIGIIGFPNAGKSSLISAISNAKPRIADYPFTTIVPNIGIVIAGDEGDFIVADIPGLIEGAHKGKGLGHKFLKHVERCRALLYLLDPASHEGISLSEQYKKLKNEIFRFNESMAEKPSMCAVNKTDLIEGRKPRIGIPGTMFISAKERTGLSALVHTMKKILDENPPAVTISRKEIFVYEQGLLVEEVEKLSDGMFRIHGRLEKTIKQIDFRQEDAAYFFRRYLKKEGVDKILKKHGLKDGDTIIIGDEEFDYFSEGD